jgi:hypothetical protein
MRFNKLTLSILAILLSSTFLFALEETKQVENMLDVWIGEWSYSGVWTETGKKVSGTFECVKEANGWLLSRSKGDLWNNLVQLVKYDPKEGCFMGHMFRKSGYSVGKIKPVSDNKLISKWESKDKKYMQEFTIDDYMVRNYRINDDGSKSLYLKVEFKKVK